MQCQPLDEALHATGTVLPAPLASPLHVADSLDAEHDRLAQIAAELIPGALLSTTHLGVPLLEEARLGPYNLRTRSPRHSAASIVPRIALTRFSISRW